MTEQTATIVSDDGRRAIAGRDVPAPGTWTIAPGHSSIGFSVRYATVTDVRGRFADFAGTVEVGEEIGASTVQVSIRTESFDTAMPVRDADMRGPGFLDTVGYPTIEFKSTGIDADGPRWRIRGDLTVHAETRPVVLDADYIGVAQTPFGEERAVFKATATIDRREFGLDRNMPLVTGGVFIGNILDIELDISAIRAT